MKFTEYISLLEFATEHGSAVLPGEFHVNPAVMGLPTISRQGKIEVLLDKKNPIYIQLSDGTKMYMTHEEFRRVKNKPEKGRMMQVVFQRLADDKTEIPSQIQSCIVY